MEREKDLDDVLRELDESGDLDDEAFDSVANLAFSKSGCRHCGSEDWESARVIKGRIVRCSDCPKWHETN